MLFVTEAISVTDPSAYDKSRETSLSAELLRNAPFENAVA